MPENPAPPSASRGPAHPRTIVVVGVSGTGKTTVAELLVELLGWAFAEGDTFHPAANVEKMRAGHPLDDEDRWPWLEALAAWIGAREREGVGAVVTCSALKRPYRDLLRRDNTSVWFAHVATSPEALRDRLAKRAGHYMPPSLLESQLATLEPLGRDEPGLTVSGEGEPAEVAGVILKGLAELEPTNPDVRTQS